MYWGNWFASFHPDTLKITLATNLPNMLLFFILWASDEQKKALKELEIRN
jgi:hypothetical protein